ncbi:MAG: hypothetical protein HQL93_03385 [Magnetococcales bacterium]|nr:hypothetical protein [Magnetococcales bacterium]
MQDQSIKRISSAPLFCAIALAFIGLAEADELIDPTLKPGFEEDLGRLNLHANKKNESHKNKLVMIYISEGKKFAVLDQTTLQEGDTFKNHLVKSIQIDQVVLQGEKGEIILSNERNNFPMVMQRR